MTGTGRKQPKAERRSASSGVKWKTVMAIGSAARSSVTGNAASRMTWSQAGISALLIRPFEYLVRPGRERLGVLEAAVLAVGTKHHDDDLVPVVFRYDRSETIPRFGQIPGLPADNVVRRFVHEGAEQLVRALHGVHAA